MTTRYRYVGEEGQFHTGIPARDLTNEDYLALSKELRRVVWKSPLYTRVVARKKEEG